MYGPCGLPRVYAYGRTPSLSELLTGHDDGDNDENVSSSDETRRSIEEIDLNSIIDLQVSRSGQLFATITAASVCIWRTSPTVLLAEFVRSAVSLKSYGTNLAILFRPDSAVVVVQTSNGYLVTYAVISDARTRVYRQQLDYSHARRQSMVRHFGTDEGEGFGEVSMRFRMAIKIDAGISTALALEDELTVATIKPAAVQCIQWTPDKQSGPSAQVLSKMDWLPKKSSVTAMVHDRAMNLFIWVMATGAAYAVRRVKSTLDESAISEESSDSSRLSAPKKLFHGYLLHDPKATENGAIKSAINARFSLLAVGCANGEILVYSAKDYVGNLPLSHKLQSPASPNTTGLLTVLTYSPDGYCLFAGYEKGWAMWSVFGKPGAHSFESNQSITATNGEAWLQGVHTANWIGGGSEILFTTRSDNRIWKLEMVRSAAAGCFSCANLVRALLQTPSEVVIYRGHDLPDLTTISAEASLWHHAQFPLAYLHNQWPIRSCVISQDGRYVAIAGRRGLAHYSIQSGRWKTFADPNVENAFAVRGGMCWYGHVLIAAVETDSTYELRLYSREADLGRLSMLHVETLPSPAIFIGPSGEDSLLVYTYDNILYHYVINVTAPVVNLVQVGQIAFHGVVRAPTRVRAVSWILPEFQMRNGDPSQDVAVASVLFLVDDKLVLLQPSQTEEGALKYEMRVIATHIETYILMRDQLSFNFLPVGDESAPPTPSAESMLNGNGSQPRESLLRDSLWTFTGDKLHMWSDIQEVLRMALEGPALKEELALLEIPVDFYPLSILLNKGVVLGVESELIQRRDVTFSVFKFAIRNKLFIPYLLRHQLSQQDTPAALTLSHQYGSLSYYAHALEVLLHEVLDDEVDYPPPSLDESLLPSVLSFIQSSVSHATYLDIILQCTRKTELRSWQTLFAHLPPPLQLFEQAIELEELKIAGGYLLILQGLEAEESDAESQHHEEAVEQQQPTSHTAMVNPSPSSSTHTKNPSTSSLTSSNINLISLAIRILHLGKQKCDWEICTELANFLIALDPHGNALNRVMREVGFFSPADQQQHSTTGGTIPTPTATTGGVAISRNRTPPSPISLTIPPLTSRGRMEGARDRGSRTASTNPVSGGERSAGQRRISGDSIGSDASSNVSDDGRRRHSPHAVEDIGAGRQSLSSMGEGDGYFSAVASPGVERPYDR